MKTKAGLQEIREAFNIEQVTKDTVRQERGQTQYQKKHKRINS